VQISSLSGFIAWFGIALSHYQFRKIYLKEHGNLDGLKFRAKFYPWAPIISMIILLLVIFGQIESLILSHSVSVLGIVVTYSSVILFAILFFTHYFYQRKKTKSLNV